jgi:uncharacterized protein YjcR
MGWSASVTQIRVHVICDSPTDSGQVCGRFAFELGVSEQSIRKWLRKCGWTFRKGATRCRQCGREGRPFGKPEASER